MGKVLGSPVVDGKTGVLLLLHNGLADNLLGHGLIARKVPYAPLGR